MQLVVADPSLVLMVGPAGSGKSTFASRNFRAGAILSSDELRRLLADDPNEQGASADAFRVLDLLVSGRLSRRLLTVVDATNLRAASRKRWRALARRYGVPAVAIVFDVPLETSLGLNRERAERSVEEWVIREQYDRFQAALADLADEGYEAIYFLRDMAEVASTTVALSR